MILEKQIRIEYIFLEKKLEQNNQTINLIQITKIDFEYIELTIPITR